MLKLSQIPDWLKTGEFFKNIDYEEDAVKNDEFRMIRHIKNDLILRNLRDILQLMDTCLYAGLDRLPSIIYYFATDNYDVCLEMDKFESDEPPCELLQYQFLIQTDEYKALRICAENPNNRYKITLEILIDEAIMNNNLPLLYYCMDDCNVGRISHFGLAVEYEHIHIAKYIIEKHEYFLPNIQLCWIHYTTAIINGDLKMIKYLCHTVNVKMSQYILSQGLYNINMEDCSILGKRKIECVVYLIKQGCPFSRHIMQLAINFDLIDVVRALLDESFVVDDWILTYAATIHWCSRDIIKLLCDYRR